jgi:hypothetical protein
MRVQELDGLGPPRQRPPNSASSGTDWLSCISLDETTTVLWNPPHSTMSGLLLIHHTGYHRYRIRHAPTILLSISGLLRV